MKRKIIQSGLVIISLSCLAFLMPAIIQINQQHITNNKIVAERVYDMLYGSLTKPIIISQSMASDTFLIEALENEESVSKAAIEKELAKYLGALRDHFGYRATYVISEKTRRYYTPEGITNIVNPLETPYDIWYQNFLDSGKQVSLDTDLDSVNDYRWTIFINVRITSRDGKLLGVCGAGVFMDDMLASIVRAEKENGIKINLIDQDGLVQVDSDLSNIETVYIPSAISDMAGSDDFTYTEQNSRTFRITRFIPEVEWYLVIQRFTMHGIKNRSLADLFITAAVLALIALLVIILSEKNRFKQHDLIKSETTLDPLTSLPNRNYVRNSFGELGIFNTTRYKTLAVMDVDRFKIINETRNGDIILKKVVELSLQRMNENALMFRWAGDEFVFFIELSLKEAEKELKKLCKAIEDSLDVTVSIGLTEVDLTVSIKTNYHRAVQQCFMIKERGGNGVGRKE